MPNIVYRVIQKIRTRNKLQEQYIDFFQIFRSIYFISSLFGAQKCKLKGKEIVPYSIGSIITVVIFNTIFFISFYLSFTKLVEPNNNDYSNRFLIYGILHIIYSINYLVINILNVYYNKKYYRLIITLQKIDSLLKDENDNKRVKVRIRVILIVQVLLHAAILLERLLRLPYFKLENFIFTTMNIIFEIDMLYTTFVVDFLYIKVKNINQHFLVFIKNRTFEDEYDENKLFDLLKYVLDSFSLLKKYSEIQVIIFSYFYLASKKIVLLINKFEVCNFLKNNLIP